jgi:hypothetical protein
MNRAECRARVRSLIDEGRLPSVHPGIAQRLGRPGNLSASGAASPQRIGATCLICGSTGPAITYSGPDGGLIDVHRTPCDDVWQAEAARPDPLADSDAGRDAEQSDPCTKDFMRWLTDRLEHDPAFQPRMEAALRHMRVERALSAMRRSVRT